MEVCWYCCDRHIYVHVQQKLPCPFGEAAWDIAILLTPFPLWRCVLLPRTHTRHVVSTLSHCSPLFSHCHSLLILPPCLTTLCSQPFTNRPDSIMWQLLFGLKYGWLPWPEAQGLSEASQDHLETTPCFWVWCMRAGTATKKEQLKGTWREMWPSHSICLKLAIPSLDSRSKIWYGGGISASGYIMGQAARWH